ncbi:carbohydrate-binding family 9-like protein [Fodinibius sediminis]|uniref:Carbohydrate family 9 binding domain-like n=1 Tax=Fodinibius sediminis TaxID=1214077 RepID=A0A521C1U6_9BACT|nr:carbohydrate-binding family 9-like protein [Fodinibius sediminis]SMO52700.1 Carbohydrate family 9 binding domain-like [Fodinibius sediminis]
MISNVIILLLAFSTIISIPSHSGQPDDPLTVKKADNFTVDGKGSAAAWSETEWVTIPQRNQATGESSMATRMKILYSDTGLYFLFECEDQTLSATMDADFMNLWKEDVVEVFLWPDTQEPTYFEYELSPLNYELPLLISNHSTEGSRDLSRWRPYMYESDRQTRHQTSVEGGPKTSGASITQWTAEFFIPFKLLRPLNNISPKSGTEWRANFYRVDYDKETTTYAWQAVEKTFHQFQKFGTLRFE